MAEPPQTPVAEKGGTALPVLQVTGSTQENDMEFAVSVTDVASLENIIQSEIIDDKPSNIPKQTELAGGDNITAYALKKLKPIHNKCILCLRNKLASLSRVAEMDSYEDIIEMMKRECSVVVSADDLLCITCSDILITAYESIANVRHICMKAVKRQATSDGEKSIFIQDFFANTLQKNMMKMFKAERMCNTTFLSSDFNAVKVHNTVIAANTSGLDAALKECKGIVVQNLGKEGLDALVHYLYTGELVLNKDIATELLPHCKDWQLYWASSMCSEVLKGTPNVLKTGPKRRRGRPTKKQAVVKKPLAKDNNTVSENANLPIVKQEIIEVELDDENSGLPDSYESGSDNKGSASPTISKKGKVSPAKRGRPKKRIKLENDTSPSRHRRPVTCSHCAKVFSRVGSMKEHIMRVHEKSRPFVCEHCGHSTTTRKDLQMHIRIKHADKIDQEEKSKFACPVCNLTRGSFTQLKLHMARKHSNERNCICEHCGMAFKTASNLREHARYMHDPKMQMKCTVIGCDRTFRGKFKLQDHIRRCHVMGEKRHKCQLCSYASHYSNSLRQHYSSKHNMRMSFLAPEWQAPHLKRHMFNKDREELSEETAAPYVVEAKTTAVSSDPQMPYFPTIDSMPETEHGDIKYKMSGASIIKPEVLNSIVQNPEVNRILFGQQENLSQNNGTEDQLVTWDGQYMEQVNAVHLYTEQELATDIQAEVEQPMEQIVCSDKREHDAAVALITVGKQEEGASVEQGLGEGTYQLHVESHGKDLYIVVPNDWKQDQN